MADGTAHAVKSSHGTVCLSAALAADKAEQARQRACLALESTSRAHEANLNVAASRYETVDSKSGANIDAEIRGR